MRSWRRAHDPSGLCGRKRSQHEDDAPAGPGPGGRRLVAHIPHGRYQTSTLISGIRLEGPCAPWLFEGPMNGEMFLAWVEQGLAPTLRAGDLVILDNLATHKIRGVREALAAAAPGCCICRRIRRISIPSSRCGARSNKSCAATLPAPTNSSSGRPEPPFNRFPSRTARASFLAPDTLHNLSPLLPAVPRIGSGRQSGGAERFSGKLAERASHRQGDKGSRDCLRSRVLQ